MISPIKSHFPTFLKDLLGGRSEVWMSNVGTMLWIIMGSVAVAQDFKLPPSDLATMAAGPMGFAAAAAALASVVSGCYVAWRAIRDGKEWPRSPAAEAIYSGLLSIATTGLMAATWLVAKAFGFSDVYALMAGLIGPFMIQVFPVVGLVSAIAGALLKRGSLRS